MKDIAIISLTRFGDLIQATPLLRTLKRAYPRARITLVVEDRFTAILPLIRGYDRVITLPKDEIAKTIVFANDPLEPYFRMESFVRELEEVRYDLVINLTFSRMSAFLTSLANAGKFAGLVSGEKGERLIHSLWGLYLFTNHEGNNRLLNHINLVDLFTRLGGVEPDGKPVELAETEKGAAFAETFLAKNGLAGEKLVGLQLGASDPVRCWSPESFARLSDLLQEKLGVRTILFGSASEEPLAGRALSCMSHPAVSAVGGTSIEELYSLLKRCSLLVTNDTGTMHFAAAGGVPSLMLCTGPAFFRGTGPYSAGNLALQADIPCAPCRYNFNCPDPVCREILSVGAVYDACCAVLRGERPDDRGHGVKIYRSYFGDDGYLDWQRCDGGDAGSEALGGRYGRMWKSCLDDSISVPHHSVVPADKASELVRIAGHGMEISAAIAAAACQTPLPLGELARLGDTETGLAGRMKLYSTVHPEYAPLVDFFSLMRDNIVTEDLPAIAEETRRCYAWARHLASSL
jgi:ADP-heptose:LPS heptosyltransferase